MRTALYKASLTATAYNSVIRKSYLHLCALDRPKKVTLIAAIAQTAHHSQCHDLSRETMDRRPFPLAENLTSNTVALGVVNRLVELLVVDSIGGETVHHAPKKLASALESPLHVPRGRHRQRLCWPHRPVVCVDEVSQFLLQEVCTRHPARPSHQDYWYRRVLTDNLFMIMAPFVLAAREGNRAAHQTGLGTGMEIPGGHALSPDLAHRSQPGVAAHPKHASWLNLAALAGPHEINVFYL